MIVELLECRFILIKAVSDITNTLTYLIPIKIHALSIFAHLACARIKGIKFAQYEWAKIKERRKNTTNE